MDGGACRCACGCGRSPADAPLAPATRPARHGRLNELAPHQNRSEIERKWSRCAFRVCKRVRHVPLEPMAARACQLASSLARARAPFAPRPQPVPGVYSARSFSRAVSSCRRLAAAAHRRRRRRRPPSRACAVPKPRGGVAPLTPGYGCIHILSQQHGCFAIGHGAHYRGAAARLDRSLRAPRAGPAGRTNALLEVQSNAGTIAVSYPTLERSGKRLRRPASLHGPQLASASETSSHARPLARDAARVH